MTEVKQHKIRPPVPFDDLPHRDADQSERLAMADLVDQICERAGVDKDFVSEIVLTPSSMEVRVQLTNDNGHRYVIGTKGDPNSHPPGTLYRDIPRCGDLAEEVVVWQITT